PGGKQMKLSPRCNRSIAALAIFSGLAASVAAEEFTFVTSTGATPASINGVAVTSEVTMSGAIYTVHGDFVLRSGDILTIVGDRPAVIEVLNNLTIEEGARIDAAAVLREPGPGGGRGGDGADDPGPRA